MAEEEVDFSKLPLEERATHKNWKARVSAYDELNKIFQKIYDEKSSEWNKYGSWVRKFPTDSNAAAQEKALEVTLLFLQRASCAGKIVSEVMSGVVAKCITATKAKSKELAQEIALTCVEIEKQEQVQEELAKGMELKNPKVVAGCIVILTSIIRFFGAKVLTLKPIVKKIPALCEDRDKTVRDETKKLIIELYRWISAALKPQLSGLKPVMLQELDAEFEKIAGEKPHPTRLLRSQQAKAEEAAICGGSEDAEEEDVVDDAVPDIDPYELMEAVDILHKIPKDFYEKCEAKKWQERKEALEAVEALVANPKIEPGDFADLVRALKKIIAKDTNILCVTLAGKCIAGLAAGLKKKFSPYAVSCIGTILEKFKEKKANVVAAMRSAIDASYEATNLEAIQEDVIQALQNKSPNVKTETNLFLSRAFAKSPYKLMSDKKLMKGYFTAILANLNESDPTVRDAAAEAMGVALKYLGEKNMTPFTADLEALKLAKVKEFAEKAVITAPKAPAEKKPKPASAPKADGPPARKGPTIKKPSTAPAAAEKRSALPKASKSGSDTNLSADAPPPAAAAAPAAKGKASRQTIAKPNAKTSPNSKKPIDDPIGSNLPVNSPKQQRILDETRLKILRWTFTTPREEFIELLKELMANAGIGKQLMTNMFSSDFKMHLKALDTLIEEANQSIEGTTSNLDLILKWLTLRFFDTNPSVLIKSLDYLSQVFRVLSDTSYIMPDIEANAFIPFLMMKIGDPKENVKTSVHNILRQVALVHSPHRVFTFIMEGVKSKNARQRAECLEELANMISTLGVSVIQPSPAAGLKEIAKQISDRDNGVRNAALNAVVQVYYFEGDKVYKMIGQLPDKTQSLLDERIKRAGKHRPIMPVVQQEPPPRAVQRPTQSSNQTSPNSATLSPQGNSKLVPPSSQHHMNNTILQQHNLNNTVNMPANYVDDEEETMLCPPPGLPNSQNFGYLPQQAMQQPEQPKATVLPEKYRLDFDSIESMFQDEPPLTQLKLLDTNIEAIMKQKPPTLPTRKMAGAPVGATLVKDKSRNNAPSRATQSIDLIISQIGQNDLRTSMEALTQLDSMISDNSIVQIMQNRVDHMLSMTSLQIHRLQATIESSNPDKLTDVNKFYRCAVAFLTSLYKGEFLPQKASKETIKDLIQNLLLLIIDPSLERLSDAGPIVRLINIMVVRIIEKSDPNSVTCALIRLLNETLTSSKQPRMLDLVMKCQWKLLKQFSVWEQWNNYEWDVTAILTEFNLFMRNHPFSSFHGQDITPLKTMKTILHALVVHLGGDVIAHHLSLMPEVLESEAGLYIKKVIQRENGKKRHGAGAVSGSNNGRSSGAGGGRSSDSVSSNHSNSTGRSNMSENYNQVSNPNNNVNDFMNSLPDPSDAPTIEAQEQAYMQRVRMILMRGGLVMPRGPSVALSKNLNDGGEESSI